MSVMIDILGAFLIAGIIFLTIFSLMGSMNQAHYEKTMNVGVQGNLVQYAYYFEFDLLKIGYHTKEDAIQYADNTTIRFKSDILNNGNIVTIQYALGDYITSTKNPNDKFIIRSQSGVAPIPASIGLTYLHIAYFDTLGRELSTPISTSGRLDSIKAMRIKIRLESAEPVFSHYSSTSEYQSVFWEKTLYPRNL